MSDRGIGDNGGPRIEKFTAKQKVDRIREVLEMDITASQKCVGVGIIVEADSDGIAVELSTKRLLTYASVSDKETVYRATKVLKEESVAEPIKVKGKPNSYRVLPAKVVAAIVDAYNQGKTSPPQTDMGSPLKPDHHVGLNQSGPTSDAVGSHGTTLPNHVGFDRTTPPEPVGFDRTTKEKIPHTPLKENTNTNNKLASLESEDRGGLAGLNGSADPMIADIVGWMTGGDRQSAKNWLSTFLGQYPQDIVRESYFALKTQIAEGKLIARPLQVWSKIAARLKTEPRQRAAAAGQQPEIPAKESTRESIVRMAEQHEEKLRQQQGRRGL